MAHSQTPVQDFLSSLAGGNGLLYRGTGKGFPSAIQTKLAMINNKRPTQERASKKKRGK